MSEKKYSEDRPNIPAGERRAVEVEAGHTCSVKLCIEHTYLEIHHINENREDNRVENLILLCDRHHKMAHAKVIDRKALKEYKKLLNETAVALPSVSPNKKDIELFENFSSLFSNNDLIRFYKEHDFSALTEKIKIDPLYEFVETWDNSRHKFVDLELEESRVMLYQSAFKLVTAITKNTTPKGHGYISVKPDHLSSGPTPQWVIDDGKEINSFAPDFVDKHENFIDA
jgi:hypothetical protein